MLKEGRFLSIVFSVTLHVLENILVYIIIFRIMHTFYSNTETSHFIHVWRMELQSTFAREVKILALNDTELNSILFWD